MELIWKILDAEKLIENGVIVKVVVSCQGNLDGMIDRVIREVSLDAPSNVANIVPFKDITEAQLLVWCKTILTADIVIGIENDVTNNLNAMKVHKDSIVTTNGLPWGLKIKRK